jgi:hypothetical protein
LQAIPTLRLTLYSTFAKSSAKHVLEPKRRQPEDASTVFAEHGHRHEREQISKKNAFMLFSFCCDFWRLMRLLTGRSVGGCAMRLAGVAGVLLLWLELDACYWAGWSEINSTVNHAMETTYQVGIAITRLDIHVVPTFDQTVPAEIMRRSILSISFLVAIAIIATRMILLGFRTPSRRNLFLLTVTFATILTIAFLHDEMIWRSKVRRARRIASRYAQLRHHIAAIEHEITEDYSVVNLGTEIDFTAVRRDSLLKFYRRSKSPPLSMQEDLGWRITFDTALDVVGMSLNAAYDCEIEYWPHSVPNDIKNEEGAQYRIARYSRIVDNWYMVKRIRITNSESESADVQTKETP